MTTQTNLDLSADIIDVRDIIARVEDLQQGDEFCGLTIEDAAEYKLLVSLLAELKGQGGDEQWRGDWYPVTLIRSSYFVDYVQELLEDCGDIPKNLPHYVHIDWQATARDIRVDYTSIDIDGVTYWFR